MEFIMLVCPKCQMTGVIIRNDRYATRVCWHCHHTWSRYAERQWALSDVWKNEYDERRELRKAVERKED